MLEFPINKRKTRANEGYRGLQTPWGQLTVVASPHLGVANHSLETPGGHRPLRPIDPMRTTDPRCKRRASYQLYATTVPA